MNNFKVLYIVYGNVINDHYNDSVEKYGYFIEKQKSYVDEGCNMRINKNLIGVVQNGLSSGSYKVVVDRFEDIDNARIKINEKIIAYRTEKLKKYTKELEKAKQFEVKKEYSLRDCY